ncbi:MAG: alginate O-acetyltransferase AlgX-related protein, partial [Chitinivibrionales bacterium]
MQLRPGILNQTENQRISNGVGLCFFIVLFWSLSLRGEVYKELVPNFDRRESRVTIRRIQKPTLADLGYAAYVSNPIRYDPESFSPDVDESRSIDEMAFDSSLSGIADSIGETPLSRDEIHRPLAWEPLQEEIWKNYQFDGMKRFGRSIESEKWGDASVFKPFQEIVSVFIHETGDVYPEIWTEIEFKEWVDFLEEDITDSDGDGFREIYGRLNTQELEGEEGYSKVLDWIKNVYTAEVLKRDEIVDWFNVLASYWYPTFNTDVMDLSNVDVWPDKTTEQEVREDLAGVEVEDPDVIIKGVPYGEAVYNVFLIPGMGKESDTGVVATGQSTEQKLDTLLSDNFVGNNRRFEKELSENGDSYKNWYESLGGFIQAEKSKLNRLNDEHPGFEGRKGWLFFRESLEYAAAGDLREQSDEKNPYKHILEFNNWLENQGIDMLFVPVPSKVEIYPEMIGKDVPDVSGKIVQPYSRKFLRDLQKAGVEVIDLLPAFLKGAQS